MEGRKSGNLRMHISIKVVLKEKVLLLHMAKFGVTYAPCAPPSSAVIEIAHCMTSRGGVISALNNIILIS